jgi:8-oxo-dGTP pyrophosphatase MutT (NUDIX family)
MNDSIRTSLSNNAYNDDRRILLDKLATYAPTTEREAACVQEFIRFVNAEPQCFERTLELGHITASAWILNPTRSKILLTHHRKLDKWLQPGGHADGNPDTLGVALREAQEESGIQDVRQLSSEIFDLDIHEIPATPTFPAHLHYDVRYVLQAAHTTFVVSEESFDLAWANIKTLEQFTDDDSVVRMREKWLNLQSIL